MTPEHLTLNHPEYISAHGLRIYSSEQRDRLKPPPNADVVLIRPQEDGSVNFFIGDGISTFDRHDRVSSLFRKYNCMDRPDALAGQVLLENPHTVDKETPQETLLEINRLLKEIIDQEGIEDPNTYFPGMIGIAGKITQDNLILSWVGDPFVLAIDNQGARMSLSIGQNQGYDMQTLAYLNGLAIMNNVTIEAARKSLAFQEHIKKTYRQKINIPGGVAVLNGQLLEQGITSLTIPLSNIKSLLIGTDGITLGNYEDNFLQYLLNNGISNPQLLLRYIVASQARRYRVKPPTFREKPSDDTAFILMQKSDIPDNLNENVYLDQIFPGMIPMWFQELVDLYNRNNFNVQDAVQQFIRKHPRRGRGGRDTYYKNKIKRFIPDVSKDSFIFTRLGWLFEGRKKMSVNEFINYYCDICEYFQYDHEKIICYLMWIVPPISRAWVNDIDLMKRFGREKFFINDVHFITTMRPPWYKALMEQKITDWIRSKNTASI